MYMFKSKEIEKDCQTEISSFKKTVCDANYYRFSTENVSISSRKFSYITIFFLNKNYTSV